MTGSRLGRDRGSASLWALSAGLVIVLFGAALAQVGVAISARHQARTAADLAALAGAARALEGTSVACGRTAEYAVANGAAVSACRLDGFDVIVTVAVATRFGTAYASARAGPVAGATDGLLQAKNLLPAPAPIG